MHTSFLYNDLDWLIYADYLDDQNINYFREDLQNDKIPWTYEYCRSGEYAGVGDRNHIGVGATGLIGGRGFLPNLGYIGSNGKIGAGINGVDDVGGVIIGIGGSIRIGI
jgi:hypothetical protein